jgi:gas vesicle protein
MAYAGKAGGPRRLQRVKSTPGNDSRAGGTLVTGLVIGALVGVAVAMLFAPERGIDMRRKLRRAAHRVGIRGQDAWEDLRIELLRARRQLKRARLKAAAATAAAEVAADVVT